MDADVIVIGAGAAGLAAARSLAAGSLRVIKAVVNISSTAATMPFGAFAHCGAAKAALNAYSRTLAVELAPSGIRVNVVSPGSSRRRVPTSLARRIPNFPLLIGSEVFR
jgi:NAD(P)-dependent dehydrogenase (short-subunit alcohol dehydrogenase family)